MESQIPAEERTFLDDVEELFSLDEFEHLLLDDVGIVKKSNWKMKGHNAYGIIKSMNGDVLFFSKGVAVYRKYREGVFTEPNPHRLDIGTPVTFRLLHHDRGLRAPIVIPWNPEDLRKTLSSEAELPAPAYRILRKSGVESIGRLPSTKPLREEVLWEGADIHELRERFPFVKYPTWDRPFTDVEYTFRRLDPRTGKWEEINDPR